MRRTALGAIFLAVQQSCYASTALATAAQVVDRRDLSTSPNPPTKQFVRRADATATVLGDYLYIVGGSISLREDRNDANEDAKVFELTKTLSLQLNQDFEAANIEYKVIDNADIPAGLKGPALWPNEKRDEIVLWGGLPPGNDSPEHKMWKLAVDGKGGGKWTSENVPDDIKLTVRGGFAECDGAGYVVGGFGNNHTDKAFDGNLNTAVTGLLEYGLGDDKWTNHSTRALNERGTYQKGSAVCVQIPDRKAKLFAIGGSAPTLFNATDDTASSLNFVNVPFWDTETQQWYEQETDGERPEPRQMTCTVGIQGPGGTYDIYMYAGYDSVGKVVEDIWILSLPAFRWFKATTKNAYSRFAHSCVVVGSQMIVVGGFREPLWQKVDHFENGIGVLDLNSLTWKDSFSADSASYEGPTAVRAWYRDRGYDTCNWQNDKVEKFFLESDGKPPTPTATSPPPSEETSEDSSGSSTPTAAIAGGVVGGVVALALIGAAIWYLRRRRRNKKVDTHAGAQGIEKDGTPVGHSSSMGKFYTGHEPPASELDAGGARNAASEMTAPRERPPTELP